MATTIEKDRIPDNIQFPDGLNLTTPGVALRDAAPERTTEGASPPSDLALWQQYKVIFDQAEWLNFSVRIGENRTSVGCSRIPISVEAKSVRSVPPDVEESLSCEELVATIRSALSLQMKELAELLGVERPTVYSWLNSRNSPQPANRDRFHTLYRLAQQWNKMSNIPLGKALHVPDENGRTLFDLLRQPEISEENVIRRFRRMARTIADKHKKSQTTVRRLARKHGIDLARVREAQDDIDLETGKRIDAE